MSGAALILGVIMAAPTTLDAIWSKTAQQIDLPTEPLNEAQYEALVDAAETVLRALAAGRVREAEREARALRSAGLSFVRLDVADTIALVDLEGGGGGYVFRVGPVDAEVILQAPHRFFDTLTGPIARYAFASARGRAFFFNSTHRHRSLDVAHVPRTTFAALTEAAVRAFVMPVIVQLHGFDRDVDVEAIVSAGTSDSERARDRALLALQSLGFSPVSFPQEIDILGGTDNIQGEMARVRGIGFVHIELSHAARERLRDPGIADVFGVALVRLLAEDSP